MNSVNQMQDRILLALHSIVDAWELEWVEILGGPFAGTVRLMQAGGFRTLLKIEYEFQPERYRLLVYRDGQHLFGRCNMDYDNEVLIEQILAQFRRLSPQTLLGPPETSALCHQLAQTTFSRTLLRSLGPHAQPGYRP